MFTRRQPHPTRGLPWELQTFACAVCSGLTTLEPTDVNAAELPDHIVPPATGRWTASTAAYTAVLRGRTYRIVGYPEGSPLAGRYGCYCDGRYLDLATSLEAAKSRCWAMAQSKIATSVQG